MRSFVLAIAAMLSFSAFAELKFEVVPESPIVINSKLTIGDMIVTGPWIRYQVQVTNNSKDAITIVGMDVAAVKMVDDFPVQNRQVVNPSDYNQPGCQYQSFGTINAGETRKLGLDSEDVNCSSSDAQFYVGNLPRVEENDYKYDIKVKFLGWIGPMNDPKDRLDAEVSFKTK